MNENKRDLFSEDIFTDMIAERMDSIDELRNRIPDEVTGEVTYVDKSFFKRVLKEVTGMGISNGIFSVYFDRGVELHIEGCPWDSDRYTNVIRGEDYRVFKILEELINYGELRLRTSPFVIDLSKQNLKANYHKSLDEFLHKKDKTMNIHDTNINCWGGFSGPVRSNFDSHNVEQSIMIMLQRMKQLNIDDYAGDIDKLSTLIKNNYKNQPININPEILARLIVEYDLERLVINNDISYFRQGSNDELIILRGVRTTINYDIFIEVLSRFSANYVGNKPKTRRRNT